MSSVQKQDVVSLSAIRFESYTWNSGGARAIHTNYLDRDRIEQWMTNMGMLIVGGLCWRTVVRGFGHWIDHWGRKLRVTVGRRVLCCSSQLEWGLLRCVRAVFNPHLPTGSVQVTREPEVVRQPFGMTLRSTRNGIINHVTEQTWSLSWYSGDQLRQLMEMLNAQCCRDALVQLLRRISIMSENQTRCSSDDRVQSEFFCGDD